MQDSYDRSEGASGLVQVTKELPAAGKAEPVLPRAQQEALAGIAAFTLDSGGRIESWPAAAAELFGLPAGEVSGRGLRDMLLAGQEENAPVGRLLTAVAGARAWAGTLVVAGSPVTIRCEPLTGQGGGTLLTVQRAQPGPGWLSGAAARIGSTLDLGRTAREAAGVAVPGFADAAAIFAPERMLAAGEPAWQQSGHAAVRRLAARLAGQPQAVTDKLLRPGETFVIDKNSPSFRAMASRGPVVFDRLDAETADRIARHPGGREVASGYASFLAMPLIARGAVVGCATFGRSARHPAFGPADLTAVGDLAAHAAVCLDNARLHDRERRIARALQQGLLPARPAVLPGLEVARRYLPVGDNIVGGDWHDIVSLPGGRTALIVGDAMGHGPDAAAVMVQLRTAAHILTALDLPPEQVLSRLDIMAAGLAAAPFAATCTCTVIDPREGSCVIAQAGHHPPVLVHPGGTTQVLDLPSGVPLGLGAEAGIGVFQAAKVAMPPGAALALYTDGLVESRTCPLEDGMASLRQTLASALARPRATLQSSCTTVTKKLRQHGEDDITLVLARIHR